MNIRFAIFQIFLVLALLVADILLLMVKTTNRLNLIIQTDFIIVLCFLTAFYAIQTKELVQQEKTNADSDRNIRKVLFKAKIMEQFHGPLLIELIQLKEKIQTTNYMGPDMKDRVKKIMRLIAKNLYALNRENAQSFLKLMNIMGEMNSCDSPESVDRLKEKKEAFKKRSDVVLLISAKDQNKLREEFEKAFSSE